MKVTGTFATESSFQSWNDVCIKHSTNLWADLPIITKELGNEEIDSMMGFYGLDCI